MEQPQKDIEELTLDEFIKLVKQMRHNQRRYRRNQKTEVLQTLEPIEKEIDDLIARYFERQTKLF